MRRISMPAALVVALAVAMSAVAGCGSSGSTANKADVEAVVANVSQGGTVTRKQATCIANEAVPKLSAKGLKEAKKKSGDLSKISTADQNAVFDAFSSCVTVAEMSPAVAKQFESGAGKIASKSDQCYEKALTSHYKTSGDLMRAVLKDPSKFAGTLTSCLSSDAIKKSLVEAMTTGGAMSEAQANCVADKVLTEVSVEDLAKAGTSSSLPADVQSKISAAVLGCASTK